MPFQPENTKYFSRRQRKFHKGAILGTATKNNTVTLGEFGIQFTSAGRINSKHMETVRRIIMKFSKNYNLYFCIFPNVSFSTKSPEARRGGGKGSFEGWYYPAQVGEMLLQIDGPSESTMKNIFDLISKKLPLRSKLVKRNEINFSTS